MTPRIIRSEPDQAFRQPPTAWQRDRMGRLQPQRETLPISRWEERATYAVVLFAVVLIVVLGVGL
jgi:hypothetical protein